MFFLQNQKFADKTRNVSSSYQVPAVNLSEKKKETSSSSNANQLKKRKRVIINAIPQTGVKTEEDNSIYPVSINAFGAPLLIYLCVCVCL